MTRPRRVARRADVYCAAAAATLVALAFLVPRILSERARGHLYAGAAPIFGNWLPHVGWGTVPAIALAVLVVRYGPDLAYRLPWRRALLLTWLTAVAWAFALAMVDGWQRGIAGRLTTRDEYLHEVGGVRDIPAMLRGFSARILDFQPDSWTTHVSGHPRAPCSPSSSSTDSACTAAPGPPCSASSPAAAQPRPSRSPSGPWEHRKTLPAWVIPDLSAQLPPQAAATRTAAISMRATRPTVDQAMASQPSTSSWAGMVTGSAPMTRSRKAAAPPML